MKTTAFLAAAAVGACLALAAPARAELVTNGDFATGDLGGWTTLTTENGWITDVGVVSFDVTDTGPQNALQVRAGMASFPGSPGGGGVSQTVTTLGGAVRFHADIAARQPGHSSNASAGRFEVFVDDELKASLDLGPIDADATLRGALDFTSLLDAGDHLLTLVVTRPNAVSGGSPWQYMTNISLVETAMNNVAEPSPAALLALAACALAASRRRARTSAAVGQTHAQHRCGTFTRDVPH